MLCFHAELKKDDDFTASSNLGAALTHVDAEVGPSQCWFSPSGRLVTESSPGSACQQPFIV